ncbi:hypothetical protein [Sandaracinus amylolyticus]|uniref:hypothetical protein n=1 Tax=Sandaracinus amylolyticus TaxID=927083 RepID=UPI001F3A8999|nr:hypothetical protein [Sandaracinus amylolyticus]UJR85805.1 Hypothetical protein I5071_78850 [Sandaracinus amylolyticus]
MRSVVALVILLVGCREPIGPPTRDSIVLHTGDGWTATGPQVAIGVSADEPDTFEFEIVTWPELEPVAHEVERSGLMRSETYTLSFLGEPSLDRWYAIRAIARTTRPVQESGGAVELEDGIWAVRFRPGSSPGLRTFSSNRERDYVDGEVELSEPVLGPSGGAFEVALDGRDCQLFDDPEGETTVGIAFACEGTGSELTLTIIEDRAAPAGGVLRARTFRVPVGTVYRDPI